MPIYCFDKIYQRLTYDEYPILELIFWKEGRNYLLVFRCVEFFLVNAPSNMKMDLFNVLPFKEIGNKADELEIVELYQSGNMNDTYIILKNNLILKIFYQFHTYYGAEVPTVRYADKIRHEKAYIEWLQEIENCMPIEIIDFRFGGLSETVV